ncbi:DUF4199 domain-containing protein [Pontibacter arcticus]|uniref:DUF4199 domain-containing protein n=1 Tax=Pontibacter arcticus TaxID=2080288 RepID=A0A364RCJ5_9BACT|nr:DUF4199 domain-containing protein [Pontibacter arcticus]RAU81994.1 DUF4199 domain-containing protein [Pontibacter arcticus]
MASSRVSWTNIALKYGILVGVAHIVYFLLMGLLGLHDKTEMSFLSAIFLAIGICLAIANFKRRRNGTIDYFQGLAIGAITGVVSSTLLALFMVLYINLFDTSYLANLQTSALFPQSLSMLSLFALTIIYGLIPGFLMAFVAMQWFRRADHSMTERV